MAIKFETATGEDLDLGVGTVTKTSPGGGTMNGTQISISTFGIAGAPTQATHVSGPPLDTIILAGQSINFSVTIVGAAIGDFVIVSYDSIGANNLIVSAFVESANLVRVVISNPNIGQFTVTNDQGEFKVLVLKAR